MTSTTRIRFIGRGGQGVVKAARILVGATLRNDNYATALPTFAFVRRGGPVESFVRISREPIRRKSQMRQQDLLAVFDPGMKEVQEGLQKTKTGGTLLINTKQASDDMTLPDNIGNVATVDATEIANRVLGKDPIPLVNTTMLGSVAAVLEELSIEALESTYSETFNGNSAPNIQAANEAFEQTGMESV